MYKVFINNDKYLFCIHHSPPFITILNYYDVFIFYLYNVRFCSVAILGVTFVVKRVMKVTKRIVKIKF